MSKTLNIWEHGVGISDWWECTARILDLFKFILRDFNIEGWNHHLCFEVLDSLDESNKDVEGVWDDSTCHP